MAERDMNDRIDSHGTLEQIIQMHPAAARVLLARRMHCVGCAIAAFETLDEACEAYGLPFDEVLEDLEAAVAADAKADAFESGELESRS